MFGGAKEAGLSNLLDRIGRDHESHEHTDTITCGSGQRAILDFTLPEPGRYVFQPHLADKGAMGWVATI